MLCVFSAWLYLHCVDVSWHAASPPLLHHRLSINCACFAAADLSFLTTAPAVSHRLAPSHIPSFVQLPDCSSDTSWCWIDLAAEQRDDEWLWHGSDMQLLERALTSLIARQMRSLRGGFKKWPSWQADCSQMFWVPAAAGWGAVPGSWCMPGSLSWHCSFCPSRSWEVWAQVCCSSLLQMPWHSLRRSELIPFSTARPGLWQHRPAPAQGLYVMLQMKVVVCLQALLN